MRKKEIEAIRKEVEIVNNLDHPKREMILKRWEKDDIEIRKITQKRINKIRKEKEIA